MDSVRIGCVKYLNTLPLIEGLAAWSQAQVVSAVPSRLIDLLMAGEIDVGLVSVIDAARAAKPVSLLPVGMIGCDGPTLTVRLFSRVPIEKITRIHADTDSHTSATLVRVILAKKFGVRPVPQIVDYDAREHHAAIGAAAAPHDGGDAPEWPDTLLLIGDKVVTDSPPAVRYPHQLDLGEAWKEMTGLPFVYAVWMCREEDVESVPVRTAAAVLDRARRHNAMRLDWVVARHAPERGWPEDLAAKYVGSYLRYDIGEPERQAVERFLAEAAELGLAEHRPVNWAGDHSRHTAAL